MTHVDPTEQIYQVLAFDYDGTLASGGRMGAHVARALGAARQGGYRLVLVSGRTWSDLQQVCAHLDLFEVVVAENGAVLCTVDEAALHDLAPPPPAPFLDVLASARLDFGTGRIILGISSSDAPTAQCLVAEYGLDWRIIRNKDAAMLVPAGIDKGTGLTQALQHLAVSPRQVIAFGDAENDEPMLGVAGLGVATGNALAQIKAKADEVLKKDNGAGIAEFVYEKLLAQER